MNKWKKIAYWVFTLWMCLGMGSSAIVQWIEMTEQQEMFTHLGYPIYLLKFLAILKIAGVVVVLTPGLLILKEWAYAGFLFVVTGAFFSHIMMSDTFSDIFPSIFLMTLTLISYFTRPDSRKIIINQKNEVIT